MRARPNSCRWRRRGWLGTMMVFHTLTCSFSNWGSRRDCCAWTASVMATEQAALAAISAITFAFNILESSLSVSPSPGEDRSVERFRLDPERRLELRLLILARHATSDVLSDNRPVLEAVPRAPPRDPDVVPLGMLLHHEVLVHTHLRLADAAFEKRLVLEIGEAPSEKGSSSSEQIRIVHPLVQIRVERHPLSHGTELETPAVDVGEAVINGVVEVREIGIVEAIVTGGSSEE